MTSWSCSFSVLFSSADTLPLPAPSTPSNRRCSHRLVGMDQTFALGSALATQTMACKSDVIGLAAGEHGMFGADISCGAMMDFSLARGAMSVDVAKIAEVYGGGADARGVLAGEVPAPKEMGPLYDRLDQIVAHVSSFFRCAGGHCCA